MNRKQRRQDKRFDRIRKKPSLMIGPLSASQQALAGLNGQFTMVTTLNGPAAKLSDRAAPPASKGAGQ